MKKTIMFGNEKFHYVGVFGEGLYYESEKHYLFTGPKSDIEFRVPKKIEKNQSLVYAEIT